MRTYPSPLERRTQTAAIIRTQIVKDCNVDIGKLKIGMKLWSTRHDGWGEIVSITKKGWIRLRISGKIHRVPIEELRRQKPHILELMEKAQKSKPDFKLFEELGIEDQRRVLKASNYCDLSIQTVMEELELT